MVKYENCLAVVGAISAERGSIVNHTRPKSIKGVDFLAFLKMLKELSPDPMTLLLDNASVHRMKTVGAFADANDMHLVYNVPYSPWLNGIEEYWGAAKIGFKKKMLS